MRIAAIICFLIIFSAPGTLLSQHTGIPSPEYADSLFTAGKHDQALIAYNRLLEIESDNYLYRFRAGLLHAWTGSYIRAEELLTELFAQNPADLDVGAALIRVISWQNRFDEALTLTEALLTQAPFNETLRALEVQLTFWNGQPGKANRMATALLQDYPDNTTATQVKASIRQSMQPLSITSYVRPWDVDNTRIHSLSQFVQSGVKPGTFVHLRASYSVAENTFTTQNARVWQTSLGVRQQLQAHWWLRADLGVSGNDEQTIGFAPSTSVQFIRGEVAASFALARYPITDTPFLISQALYLTESVLIGNYAAGPHEINGRIIAGWLSDSNRRVLLSASYAWQTKLAEITYTPGFVSEYRSFNTPGTGYFAPDWQYWTSIRQQVRYDENTSYFGEVTLETGLQQFKIHGLEAEDPASKLEINILAGYRPAPGWELELGYTYTNVAGLSTQSAAGDYWGQVVRGRVQIQF